MPNSRSYCFTYWKMPELINDYLLKLKQLPKCRYVIAQLEESKEKNTHIQGYIEFTDKVSMKPIKKIMPGIHLEPRKGSRDQARNYCLKSESQLAPPIEYGDFSTGGQGKRNDITHLKEVISSGKKLKDVVWEDCKNYQNIRIAEKLVQYNQKSRDPNKPPEIRWYWGCTGAGKTKSVYDEFSPDDIYSSSQYKWWDGYEQHKCILIDDMRKDYCKFHVLLKLLDRYPHQVQIKGSTAQINSPVIIITSAFHPSELWCGREDINQLLRRINVIKHFVKKPETHSVKTERAKRKKTRGAVIKNDAMLSDSESETDSASLFNLGETFFPNACSSDDSGIK